MKSVLLLLLAVILTGTVRGQGPVIVRPSEIDDVLVNPGIGFMTFQRFNGDALNEGKGWTEGYPIVYQPFRGSLETADHPMTSIAYFRIYWKFLEPEKGKYNWELIDKALRTAHERKQTLMLRFAPYGSKPDNDVPDWYRVVTGEDPNRKLPVAKWRVDPENPEYARLFGAFVRAVGARYDGHPGVELVDVSIIGAWGEGAGSELLSKPVKQALLDSYFESFRKTPLVIQPNDAGDYRNFHREVGWRVDCLGDMPRNDPNWGRFLGWSHMYDFYPQAIMNLGLQDAWEKAPVTMEACGVMQSWKDRGWDIDYIIDQSLKWHISSFNGKSSAVPKEWGPQVDRWLNRMGYRFVLRKFTYPAALKPNDPLAFTSWWENKGVAPSYRPFTLALRLRNEKTTYVLPTDADIRRWLPGDSVYDDAVFVPADAPPGDYDLSIGVLDPITRQAKVKLAIAGIEPDGWYRLGKITVQATPQ